MKKRLVDPLIKIIPILDTHSGGIGGRLQNMIKKVSIGINIDCSNRPRPNPQSLHRRRRGVGHRNIHWTQQLHQQFKGNMQDTAQELRIVRITPFPVREGCFKP